jgi:hypothetical protein
MLDRRFPICTRPVPPCLGREALLARIRTALTKPNPNHLQVIGPRFGGKTVLLTELVRHLKNAGAPYTTVFLWDLAHQTLKDDGHFIHSFGRELARALSANYPAYAQHLEAGEVISSAEIAEVLEALKDEGCRVLAVCDGVDRVVANGRLTRNLWDQLRELAARPSLRLVTVSRKRLSELIRDPNAETSPFWNIFEQPAVRIGPFDDQDLDLLLKQTPEVRLTNGARTELMNETNASPLLMLEALNTLLADGRAREVSAEDMRKACDLTFPAVRDRIGLLWADCAPTTQDLFHRVREVDSVSLNEVPAIDADTLIDQGFVHSATNKLRRPSRLLGRFLDEQPNEGNAIARLFGTADAYLKNLKSVLERRIGQIKGVDPTLKRFIERGTGDLPDHPDVFLSNVRGIVNQAFELIWKAEIPNKRIPSDWMAIWKRNEKRRFDEWETTFPQGGQRLGLLNLMTGTESSPRFAKYVTKGTHVLMDAVYAFGDFGQHQEGAPVDLGTAYTALHLCVELAAALSRELPAGQ